IVPRARTADAEDAGVNCQLPLCARLPVLRWSHGRPCSARQGSRAGDPRSAVCVMASLADKFSRIAALKPARSISRPATLRAPDREDFLCQLLGAAIATNRYGEHVCVRNWFSSPALTEPAEVTLRLLARSRDDTLSKRMQVALSDPEKWLFLDTETTGLSGGTGTCAFLVGLAWWGAGGLQGEQLFLRVFAEAHPIFHAV